MKKISYEVFQVVQLAYTQKHDDLLKYFPDLRYSLGQQEQFAKYLLITGQVKRVIKVNEPFSAVCGHCYFDHDLNERDLVSCKPGFYISHTYSAYDQNVQHVHLADVEGNVITVVNIRDLHGVPWQPNAGSETVEVLNIGYVTTKQAGVGDILLSKSDVDLLFNVNPNDSQQQHSELHEEHLAFSERTDEFLENTHLISKLKESRLGRIYLIESKKYCSGEQEWRGQAICRKWLYKNYSRLTPRLTENEVKTLVKMLTDQFSPRRK